MEQAKLKKQFQNEYDAKVKELEAQQQVRKARAVVASHDIPAGATLQSEDLQVIDIPAGSSSSAAITEPSKAIGKIAKIDLGKHTPLIASMLFEEAALPKDLRSKEFNIIQLPTNLQKGQFVDVRINFPTGQDYIVLAKKKVQELSGGIVWYEMDEQEILMMSSAIIDAYLQGARLYALTYVDPGMQEKAIANYPANTKVLDLLESDPNLLEKAKTELTRRLRTILDNDLKEMDDIQKMKVTNGSVTVQQQIQNSQIVAEQNNAMRQSVQQQGQQSGQADKAVPSPEPMASPSPTPFPTQAPSADTDIAVTDKQKQVFEQSNNEVSP
ncbi:hypothetical protein B5M42_020950 [Paenibacillus athensensis]|nr:hypothetical protein [Paenibacillus athensensis]